MKAKSGGGLPPTKKQPSGNISAHLEGISVKVLSTWPLNHRRAPRLGRV